MRHEWIYATDAQEAYLRRLAAACAPLRCAPYALGRRRLLRSEASRAIDDFRAALAEAQKVSALYGD